VDKPKINVKTYILERLSSIRRAEELGIRDRFLEGEKFALETLYNLLCER